jgi:hypothetical protein
LHDRWEERVNKTAKAHESTVRDLQAERASALARVTEELERALAELREADLAAGSPGAAERRKEALAHAGERLWCLIVQREALGLTRHEVLYDVLRVPPLVRAAAGPRRRRR